MSKYINLDDPDVTYSHNAGNHEVYIVGSEAERIDIVRCGECIHHDVFGRTTKYYGCKFYDIAVDADHFCKKGERRADDESDTNGA